MEYEFSPVTEPEDDPLSPYDEELQREARLKNARRIGNRVGLGVLTYMLAALLLSTVLQVVLLVISPDLYENTIVLMVLSDLGTYLVGPLICWLIIRPLPSADLLQRGITPVRFGKLTVEAIGLMYTFSILSSLLTALISMLRGSELGSLLTTITDSMPLWAMFIIMVVVAPPCEEFIFRHLLYRRLQPLGTGCAILIDGLMFGLFHCNLEQFFYAFALGTFFSLIVAKTGRLRYTIILHMILNFLGSVAIYALDPYPMALTVYSIALYVLMAVGILVLILDRKKLAPAEHTERGIWRSVLLAPGMLACIIILGIISVVTIFLV